MLLLLLAGCGPDRREPSNRVPGGSVDPDGQVVSGSGRLAWDQLAPDAVAIGQYSYAAYVDEVRIELNDATCSSEGSPRSYSCSARLPPLSPGRHVIELVTIHTFNGMTTESERSAPIVVRVVGSSDLDAVGSRSEERTFTSPSGTYRVQVVARNLSTPVALTFTPDHRLIVAERSGTIRIFEPGPGFSQVALTPDDLREHGEVIVHALTLHPLFSLNRLLFLLYTMVDDSGAVMRLVRLREINNALGEPAVLLDGVPSSSARPTAGLAFGRDGQLYVATNSADLPSDAADAATLTGKVLRLNVDGTAANNGILGSLVFAAGIQQPVAFDWNPLTGRMWLLERSQPGATTDGVPQRADVEVLLRHAATGARVYRGSVLSAFRNDLFIAGEDEQLERVRFDPSDGRWRTQDVLVPGWFGRLQTVTEGPDGALYVASGNSTATGVAGRDVVFRIVPAPPPSSGSFPRPLR